MSKINPYEFLEKIDAPIFVEDFSVLVRALDSLRDAGVSDFREYLSQNPEQVRDLSRLIVVRFANQAALKLFEAESWDVFVRSFPEVFSEDSFGTFERELVAFAKGEGRFEDTDAQISLEGRSIHVKLSIAIPGRNEDFSQVPVLMEDVTEKMAAEERLRRAEHRYRSLVETSKIVPWEVDLSTWCFTYVAPQVKNLLGYPIESWYQKDFWSDHIHVDDRGWAIDYCVLQTKRAENHEFEYRMVAADGSIVWIYDLVTVVLEGGKPAKLQGVMVDITKRREAERQLVRSLGEKEVLLRELHHRVKNNMQLVDSMLSLQERRLPDGPGRAALQRSRGRIKAIMAVHEDLYRSEKSSVIDFGPYAERLVSGLLLAYAIEGKPIKADIDIGGVGLEIGIAIPCGLIVNELVSNSLKHAFKNSDRGTLGVELKEEAATEMVLRVWDDGEPGGALNENDPTSMGLKLVALLVGQLGGTLRQKIGQGTEFIIEFSVSPPQGEG